MWPDLNVQAIRAALGTALPVPFLLAVQSPDDAPEALRAAEREQLAGMSSASRQQDYKQGRAALKRILSELGRNTDTTLLQWPDAQCALSHSGGYAIAVGLASGSGIGVDLQLHKAPPDAVAGRILSHNTLDYWQALPEPERAPALQRLWTANEAIYKACPGPQPAYFRHYRLLQPQCLYSEAVIDGTDYVFKVASMVLPCGFLSIAMRL